MVTKRTLAGLLLITLLLSPGLAKGRPAPTGTLTRVGTGLPITYTITFSNVRRRDSIWVSTSCFDSTGERNYYGEDFNPDNRLGPYIMDDTAWVLWTPVGQNPQPGNNCRTFLLYRPEGGVGDIVLDDSGFFTVT